MKRSRRIALPLLAAGLGACVPDSPTLPPADAPALDVSAESGSAYAAAAGLAEAADDAATRVLPTLGASQAASDATAAFAALAAAAGSDDGAGARTAAASARAAVDALEAADPEVSGVELAALRLVLDSADELYPAL